MVAGTLVAVAPTSTASSSERIEEWRSRWTSSRWNHLESIVPLLADPLVAARLLWWMLSRSHGHCQSILPEEESSNSGSYYWLSLTVSLAAASSTALTTLPMQPDTLGAESTDIYDIHLQLQGWDLVAGSSRLQVCTEASDTQTAPLAGTASAVPV